MGRGMVEVEGVDGQGRLHSFYVNNVTFYLHKKVSRL